MQVVRIEANIAFAAYRSQHDGQWVAVCEPLGITVEGDTWNDIQNSINDGLNLILRDVLSRGELDPYLRSRGWSIVHRDRFDPTNLVRFDVPFRVAPVAQDEPGQFAHS